MQYFLGENSRKEWLGVIIKFQLLGFSSERAEVLMDVSEGLILDENMCYVSIEIIKHNQIVSVLRAWK